MILDHATSSSSSTTSSPTSKFKRLPSATTKIINLPNEKIQSSTNLKIDALQGYKKGTSASEAVTKAQLESTRRSIEYRITQEAKITRHLFAAHNNVGDIDKIMNDEQINDMPKLNLEDFQDFDTQLKTNLELIKKLKCFMLINIKSGLKVTENLTAVMPRIMSKDVQLLFSGFGRETNGCKKLNFSATQTYKYLLEVITTKDPNLKIKDISSQLSRWFSGAKDREGGKKERQYYKMKKSSESTEDKIQ
ncbi:uncharacterized protein LOC132932485 [Metopolophium dirhodum]|uniref:uncharacterized protein LOC132932485 n=1 Tax=Metopolophium dirhodum TaxID=44670 RepID=UPI0029908317|nr:uncharacterized protein LOC132932485 [Metopolophium dirhodum]